MVNTGLVKELFSVLKSSVSFASYMKDYTPKVNVSAPCQSVAEIMGKTDSGNSFTGSTVSRIGLEQEGWGCLTQNLRFGC